MIAPQWWSDLKQYQQRLQQYSDDDLLDVYFHIHPVRYRAHYLCVLRELRRRGIKPQIAERPLAGLRWDLPQWVNALSWAQRSLLASRLLLAGLTLTLPLILTGLLLTPIVVALRMIQYLDPFTGLLLLMGAIWAWGVGVALSYRAGARGGWMLPALLGSSTALWVFLRSCAFARIVDALHEPIRGGGWGF